MKKITLLLFLSLSAIVHSQEFGIHFGLNFSNLLYKNSSRNVSKELDYKNTLGLNFGLDFRTKIYKNISINSGLNYSQKGFKNEEKNNGNTTSLAVSSRLDYLELPINLRIDTNKSLFFKSGPYFSYLLGGKYSAPDYPYELKFEDEFGKFDYGLLFGLGFKIKEMTLDFDYTLGLHNITSSSKENIEINEDNRKNRTLSIRLTYWL